MPSRRFLHPSGLRLSASHPPMAQIQPKKLTVPNGIEFCWELNNLVLFFNNAATKNAVSLAWASFLEEFVISLKDKHCCIELCGKEKLFVETKQIAALTMASKVPGVFVSGGDLKELFDTPRSRSLEFHSKMRNVCRALSQLPFATFAILEGPAYGGGAELALAVDFRLAAQSTPPTNPSLQPSLHLWQAKWGLPGGWNGMARLQELCPFLTPRRTAVLFACQASLSFETLAKWNLLEFEIDSPNGQASENELFCRAISKIQEFCSGFLQSPEDLRAELFTRSVRQGENMVANTFAQADELLFERHWHGKNHLKRLAKFMSKKIPLISPMILCFLTWGCGVKTPPSPLLPGMEKRYSREIKLRKAQEIDENTKKPTEGGNQSLSKQTNPIDNKTNASGGQP